jgi:hypothetical protein
LLKKVPSKNNAVGQDGRANLATALERFGTVLAVARSPNGIQFFAREQRRSTARLIGIPGRLSLRMLTIGPRDQFTAAMDAL